MSNFKDNSLIESLKKLNRKYNDNENLRGVRLHTKQNSNCMLYDVRRGIVNSVKKEFMNKFMLMNNFDFKIAIEGKYVFCMYNFNRKIYKPEIGIPSIFTGTFNFVMDKAMLMKGLARESGSDEMNAFLINLLTIIVDAFGFKSMTSWISIIMRVYSLILTYSGFRKRNKYEPINAYPQIDFTDVATTLVLYGLPEYIIKAVRDFQTLVNVRIQAGSFITKCLRKMIHIIKSLLTWAFEKTEKTMFKTVHDFVDKHFSFVLHMDYIEGINELYSKYVKNSQVILDVNYRNEVLEVDLKTAADLEFMTFLSRPEMKSYKDLYFAFKINIVKYVKTFTVSSRKEPVCVVFEGPPGCRKSALMNQIVQLCKKLNRSVITHNVPSVNAGKDFYDDYENQDVFVSDDIGQMDNSQWRVIINAVAPVKYPLECANAEKKNTKFFNSNLILGTTNHLTGIQSFTSKDCISDKEALFRRIHVFKFASVSKYDISYMKYDFKGTHKWENKFLDGMKDYEQNVKMEGSFSSTEDNKKVIAWIYSIIMEAERINLAYAQAGELSNTDLDDIQAMLGIEEEEFFDAEFAPEGFVADLFHDGWNKYINWSMYCGVLIEEMITSMIPKIGNITFLSEVVGLLLVCCTLKYAWSFVEGKSDNIDDLKSFRDSYAHHFFEGQSINENPDYVNTSKQHCFFAKITSTVDGKRDTINTQCTMSGNYILVNDHAVGDEPIVNIYKDWLAFEANNMMFNNLPVVVEERILSEDLAILRIEKFPVTPIRVYRWPKDDDVDFHKAKDLYCVNSDIIKPMKNRGNCYVNSGIVKYKLHSEYVMYPGETISYDLSCPGLCGSLLVSEAGIPLGHHIAGNLDTKEGVIKLWTRQTREKIKNIFSGKGGTYAPVFKDLADFSGMRFMQTDLNSSRTMNKSGFKPTSMNSIREEEEFNDIIDDLEQQPFVVPRQLKAPANLAAFGNKTLKEMSKKSYKVIPMIDGSEVEFAKKCLASQFVKFQQVTDYEAAFGTEELTEMNRKSVNGYGYDKEKSKYFDYENKRIEPKFLEAVEDFKRRALDDNLLVSDILCVEALKDELRPIEKVNKPRSYRILPLHHTFLTKKYVAQLFLHIKRNMWTNGIAIGMNPYMDFDKLYKVLKTKSVHFDGDFGKYDGSAPSQLQDAIVDVVLSFFEGSGEDVKIFKSLLNSLIRSYVLTNEELYLTTHSLPSGCWVTALFNSFLNKMLTAVCLKRNKPNATVEEWASIADFTLGDDKLVAVNSSLGQYVNAIKMRQVAESLGMEYTDARKGDITSPSKPLDECQFLKRMFVYNHDLKKRVGVLDINTIVETLRFFDSSKEYEEAMDGKMTAIQFELFLYGHYGAPLCAYLKEKANERGITYKEFHKQHIMKSMTDPETYASLLAIQGKYNAN